MICIERAQAAPGHAQRPPQPAEPQKACSGDCGRCSRMREHPGRALREPVPACGRRQGVQNDRGERRRPSSGRHQHRRMRGAAGARGNPHAVIIVRTTAVGAHQHHTLGGTHFEARRPALKPVDELRNDRKRQVEQHRHHGEACGHAQRRDAPGHRTRPGAGHAPPRCAQVVQEQAVARTQAPTVWNRRPRR